MARTKVRKKKNIKGANKFTEKIKKVVLGTSISHPSKLEATNNLFRLIARTPSTKSKYLIDDIYQFPAAKKLLNKYSVDYNDLVMPGQVWLAPEVEVSLFLKAVESNKVELSEFLEKTLKFEKLYLYGKYKEALELLKAINAQFGPTLWAIENQINLIEVA